jgi:hypothetical protein
MIPNFARSPRRWAPAGYVFAAAFVGACSSSSPGPQPSENVPDASDAAATCASPGGPTAGPADTHCAGMDPQPTTEASCHPDGGPAADAGPDEECPYGDTMFGHEGDDDDCKYHVVWSSTSICESTSVIFTVTITNLTDGTPATAANMPMGIMVEPFIPATLDASCDDKALPSAPISLSIGSYLPETPPGSGIYQGPVVFPAAGEWTLRFHIHEECEDLLPDSPHGHAAFHIDVP